MITDNPAKGVVWDLTSLYSGLKDPQLDKDIEEVLNFSKEFTKKNKGKVSSADLTPQVYKEMLSQMIEADEKLLMLERFSGLMASKEESNEEISALRHKISEMSAKYYAELAWFSLERKSWTEEKATEMIDAPELSMFRHLHTHERALIPFVLTEKEEAILSRFSPVGGNSLMTLYSRLQSGYKFKLMVDSEEKTLNLSEVSKLATKHKDREVRKEASKKIEQEIKKYEVTNAHIQNTLLNASKISDEVRGFKYPEHATYLDNETPKETVEAMISAVEESYDISQRYFKAKKEILGFDELFSWDRSVAPFPEDTQRYSWEEAKNIVLGAFEEFDSGFADLARKFFDENWIDAELGESKGAGAFCSFGTPDSNPYISLNFTGIITDVTSLAHELGHGVHALLSRNQSLYEFWPSTATAEIASVFAESLVFDYLYKDIENKKSKINLLGNKIEESFATIFIQTAFHLFEQDTHYHMREKGELKMEDFKKYYKNRYSAVYGESVTLSDEFSSRWAYISHFFNYDFYVYTYAFGELLTASLYAKYKEGGNDFVSDYIKGLAFGGSTDPYTITKTMGVDINDTGFWQSGLDILNKQVMEYEKLVK